MESTRADHTSLEGYQRDTTPELQRLAASDQGRAFSECFSHGIWTLPSSGSILTGTYPTHHTAGIESERIPDELETVPELLSEVGYTTGCLSPNAHLSPATGLDRGFDRFAWLSKSNLLETVGLRLLVKYFLYVRRHGGGLTTDTRKHSRGFVMNELAKRWLGRFGDDEPFFLYCHHANPHQPYYPPGPYFDRFTDGLEMSPREAGEFVLETYQDVNRTIARGLDFDEDEWRAIHAMYDGEIAYTDALIGDLFDHVRSKNLGDTVFVVTADHGELLGERGLLAHKIAINDAVSHVPLVVHGLPELVGYEGEQAQHVDVIRTLLEEAGARTEQLQGLDLRTERRTRSIIQRGGRRCRKTLEAFREYNPDFPADEIRHRRTLSAIHTGDFRYQRSADGAELVRPSGDDTDVSDQHPAVAERLDAALTGFLEAEGCPVIEQSRSGTFSEAMRNQLSDLGYIVE